MSLSRRFVKNQDLTSFWCPQWELFLRHVALDEPFRWNLLEGAKGVQLAEYGLKSSEERKWLELPTLEA